MYTHSVYGKVKVLMIKKNTGEKKDRISHFVVFQTNHDRQSQGINGFEYDTTEIKK